MFAPPFTSCGQRLAKEAQPVAVEDQVDVGVSITASGENSAEALKVADRIEIVRRLFRAKTTVEIAADARMSNATGELTDVVDVIGDGIQPHDLRRRLAALPAGV